MVVVLSENSHFVKLELDQVIQDQGLVLNITVLSIYKGVHDPGNLSLNARNEKQFKNAKPQSGMINIFDKEMKELSLFSSTAKSKGIFMYILSNIKKSKIFPTFLSIIFIRQIDGVIAAVIQL